MSARLAARRAAGMTSQGLGSQPIAGISRSAGRYRGTMANWSPFVSTRQEIPRERPLIARRAEDLAANDPHASSLVGGMSINVVGAGIKAQSQIDAKALRITEDQAAQVQSQAERAFAIWCKEADAGGRMTFEELQYQAIWSAVTLGEYLYLCRMLDKKDKPERTFRFALRGLSPQRMSTPSDLLMDPMVVEGVQLGEEGEALGYWLQKPDIYTGRLLEGMSSGFYVYNQARAGHRPVVLHAFPSAGPERVRGESVLTPAMKFFRDLADCLDYNLVGQIIAAAFPVAIYTENQPGYPQPPAPGGTPPQKHFYNELSPASVAYLNEGERIQTIANPNPPNTFDAFVERILRAAGSAAGMPYEVVARDFSKTNYSSARAALLEACRVFTRYQVWLSGALLQPCWEAVFEEAYLMGMIELPKGAPDFYDARHDWTNCMWIPPKRGHVDPLKEMAADIEGLKAGITTFAEVIESRGGDWENSFSQQARERKRRTDLKLPLPEDTGKVTISENSAATDAASEQEEIPGARAPGDAKGGKAA